MLAGIGQVGIGGLEAAAPCSSGPPRWHTVMAHVYLIRREHEKALALAEDALGLRPICANANSHYANILYYCGRPARPAGISSTAISLARAPQFSLLNAANDGGEQLAYLGLAAHALFELCLNLDRRSVPAVVVFRPSMGVG